ncbi:MAG: PEP-CTERM sorting domain-containing protein [Pirellulales bacterium]
MRTHLIRTCAALSLVGLALAVAAPARAVTVPINFTGTEQDFDGTVDLTGNLNAVGSGVVFGQNFTITQNNYPLSLVGGAVTVSTDPITDPPGTTFDAIVGDLLDMNDLDLDLLNGQTSNFNITPITILTNNALVNLILANGVKVGGTLTDLRFDQTGLATVLGGAGSGTFSVAGDLSATVDNLLADIAGIQTVAVAATSVSLPYLLTGTWTMSGPALATKIELDGSANLSVPVSLLTALATDVGVAALTASIDLAASLTVAFNYHLEDVVAIPEPSSIVLLALGLCAAMIPAAHRLRRRRS